MADKDENFRTTEIFWSKEDSDSGDNGLVPATGLKSEGNKRPVKGKKVMKVRKTKEITAAVVGRSSKPLVTELPLKSKDTSKASNGEAQDRKASLKDLCLEDKKRVANLIKELARLGEEKETMSELLQNERDLFEDKINEVLQQQDCILKEREGIEVQLADCQQLIEKYQQVLKEKEDALALPPNHHAKKHRGVHFMNCRPELHQYTPENAKGVPTRKHYDQEIEVERYSPIPKQHSNYNNDPPHTRTQRPGSYKNFPEALKQASTPTPESKPSTVYIPKPPHREAEGDRPFTSMIDKLINQERNSSSRSVEDRDIQLGPLVNPKFVKPQQGGLNVHSSSCDFQPLQSECASPSLYENGAAQGIAVSGPLSTPVPWGMGQPVDGTEGMNCSSLLSQLPNSSVTTAPIPEGLDDREFLQQYRELNPEQRKQQLFVQKQALMQEQERLKKILNEQEKLLDIKQVQLRKQQDIQKERLSYFDRTGTFPPNFDYSELRGNRDSQGIEQPVVYPGMNSFGHMYTKQPFMPVPPQVNHILPSQTMTYNPGFPLMYSPAANPYNTAYMSGPIRQEGEMRTKDCTANKENQSVFASTRQTRSACTSPMPSNYPSTVDCGTSPLKSQPAGRPSERQPHNKSNSSHKPTKDRQIIKKEQRIFTDYRDERASQLLDLVDEVESLHNSKSSEPVESLRPYLSPSRIEKPKQVSLDPFQDSLVEEDSEEFEEPRLSLSGLIRRDPVLLQDHESRVNGGLMVGREDKGWGSAKGGEFERGWGSEKGREFERGYGWKGGRQEWEMEQSSDDLEESQVLEDVFFIK